jgi:hypothetical protein
MGPGTKGAGQTLDDEFDDESEDLGVPPQRMYGRVEAVDEYDDEVIHIVGCQRDEDCDCAEDS